MYASEHWIDIRKTQLKLRNFNIVGRGEVNRKQFKSPFCNKNEIKEYTEYRTLKQFQECIPVVFTNGIIYCMQIVYKYNNAKAAEVERKLFYVIMICTVTYNFF